MRLLRVVRSSRLDCGCFVGLYETYDGTTRYIIDHLADGCAGRGHHPGHVL